MVEASTGRLIVSGPLAGLVQSINRAELVAVVATLDCFTRQGPCALTIWSGSAYVVQRLRGLLAHASQPAGSHTDLWMQVQGLLSDLGAETT